MKSDAAAQDRVHEYLLGRLSDGDREQFEERLLSDSELYQELVIVEDELVDDYLRDELTAADRSGFESHFLAAHEHQEKLRFARALQRFVAAEHSNPASESSRAATVDVGKEPPSRDSRGSRWFGFLPFRNPVFAYATVVVLIGLAVGVGWIVWNKLASSSQPGRVVAVVLTPGATRGEGATQKLNLPGDASGADLHLQVPAGGNYQSYQAVLYTVDGSEIFRSNGLNPQADAEMVIMRVPSRALSVGDYYVALSGRNAAGNYDPLARYSFRVTRQ